MELTRTAHGIWSGGRFMNFGEPLAEDRFISVIQRAYERGIRTFVTADVYSLGAADEMMGRALAGIPRDNYCLVGLIGHDIYSGKRDGSKGYPRFTNPELRPPSQYADYLRMATEKSLTRCRTGKFDLLMLHNPDATGYSHDAVWTGMDKLREAGLTERIGVAPGPANGFTLDILLCFERFAALLDWAMIILNPLEPWPGNLCLSAAQKHDIQLLTRVVDYGGIFHDDVKPGHKFGQQDHRAFRPAGWVEAGCEKLEKMRDIARRHNVTMLQLACLWNFMQPAVKSVVPTLIQESGADTKPIETKVDELASVPDVRLTEEECDFIARIGNNKGCMELKGGNPDFTGVAQADRWPLNPELETIARRWSIEPKRDLGYAHKTA
ncbi:MAG: aldo/keto reductase [Verrucomicrobia bacterium]|nr:aldo/keto reductase [Verrucomicrobiota bacterium]